MLKGLAFQRLGLKPPGDKTFLDCGVVQDLGQGIAKFFPHLAGNPRWRIHRPPCREVEIRDPLLIDGHDTGCRRARGRTRYGDGAKATCLDQRIDGSRMIEHEVDVPGGKICQRARRILVRRVDDIDPCANLEEFTCQLTGGTVA